MRTIARLRDLDNRAWATATWSAPIISPNVLGGMFVLLWLLGKLPAFTIHERAWFITGAVVTVIVSTPVVGVMLTSRSSYVRGLALSLAGSSAIVLVGGIIAGFLIFR
jgi:hypothetical protein